MALPDWPRAHGAPLFSAVLRSQPQDFRVCELLGWEASGDGEHDLLCIEKIGANTDWVARQLAQYAGVPLRDVGYAGLKDRHAVTRQWFSVPRWRRPDWAALSVPGVQVLEVRRHTRKLRRGAHRANSFSIVVRHEDSIDRDAVTARLSLLREHGVPNYFGEQRFGRRGANLQLADDWAAGRRLPRHQRSLAPSVVRAFSFNEVLAARVGTLTWNTLMPGDKANLDGTASVFDVTAVDADLRSRCESMDLHPAIALAGEGGALKNSSWQQALDRARVQPGKRSLRLRVQELCVEFAGQAMTLRFTLPRGAYATAVLREICRWGSEE
jgi:tRNA pseudouridine13 synthase